MIQDAPKLADVLAGAQLPALPQSAIRLLELSQDPDNGPAEFTVPIEADPGLTGQVLRFVNSSYFGFSREISSIKLAITLVGIRTIKNFALWSAVFSLMPNPKCGAFDLKSLWKDSLRRALLARNFGKLIGMKDAEDVFAAALLQDMAVPVLSKELADSYGELLNQRGETSVRLSTLEQEAYGWTHADAAAAMARSWSLPESFAQYIEHHVETEQYLADASTDADPGEVAVAVSSLLPSSSEEIWQDREQFDRACAKFLPADAPPIIEILAQVDEQFEEFAPLLKVNSAGKTIVEIYEETEVVSS